MNDNERKFWIAFTICAVLLILGVVACITAEDMYEMGHVKPQIIQHYTWPRSNSN